MYLQTINQPFPKNQTNFKSAVPCFVYLVPVGKTLNEALPITTNKNITGYLQMIVKYINNSLKRNLDTKRDNYIDGLRNFINGQIKDFQYQKVLAFTCADGGRDGNKLRPLFYITTGKTKDAILNLRNKLAEELKLSDGYKTADSKIAEHNYGYNGREIVRQGFQELEAPKALHIYMQDTYTPKGEVQHKFIKWKCLETDAKDPIVEIHK